MLKTAWNSLGASDKGKNDVTPGSPADPKLSENVHRRSQDFGLRGEGFKPKKKESSQFDLEFVIGGGRGGRNLVGDQFWIGGENLKLQRSAWAEKPILSRKLNEDRKKRSLRFAVKSQTRLGTGTENH